MKGSRSPSGDVSMLVSTARLRDLEVGESRIFTESPKKVYNAGAQVQMICCRLGYKATTHKCVIVFPDRTSNCVDAVFVTRLS